VLRGRARLAPALALAAAIGAAPRRAAAPEITGAPVFLALGPVSMPGPARARPGRSSAAAAAKNAACARCHADIAAEHEGSLHRRAHEEPAYLRALAVEPLDFCERCHAPVADPLELDPAAVAATARLGVACVTCHGEDDVVLAAPAREGTRPAPHPLLRSAELASDAACARCHEFEFPDNELRRSPAFLQRTITEHAASGWSEVRCAGCHMPLVPGPFGPHRAHGMPASRDAEVLRRALTVSAMRVGTMLQLELAPDAVGHAVPTGDLFRRLVVIAEAERGQGRAVASARRYLSRRFSVKEQRGGVRMRIESGDDRPGAPDADKQATRVELDLGPDARDLPIRWRVIYERVEHPTGPRDKDAVIEGAEVLAEGTVEG
jgi:hypothetical protein